MRAAKSKDQQKYKKPPLERADKKISERVVRPLKFVLQFTPTAWAKLQYFCHRGDSEVGGFGVTSPENPLLIEEFLTVEQHVSWASVSFDDEAVADHFEDQVDLGRRPENFSRIWLHTHPGSSPTPSSTDEETFERVFGRCDWAVMFILACGGQTYARLRFNAGLEGELLLPVEIDYAQPFSGTDYASWEEEYKKHIFQESMLSSGRQKKVALAAAGHTATTIGEPLDAESAYLAGWPFIEDADEDYFGADGEEDDLIDFDVDYWLHEYPLEMREDDFDPEQEEERCESTTTRS